MYDTEKVLILFIFVIGIEAQSQNNIYVTPLSSSMCTQQPCYTLNYYAEHSVEYFTTQTTVLFLPGVHRLDTTIVIDNVTNFTMAAQASSAEQDVHIVCTSNDNGNSSLYFGSSTLIVLQHIQISNCGGITFSSVTDITLNGITIHRSSGALTLQNILGKILISGSEFSNSKENVDFIASWEEFKHPCYMLIKNCTFQNSAQDSLRVVIGNSANDSDPLITVELETVGFKFAANQSIELFLSGDASYTITMSNIVLVENNGASFYVHQDCPSGNITSWHNRALKILTTKIQNNIAGLHLHICDINVTVQDSKFMYNRMIFMPFFPTYMRDTIVGILPSNAHLANRAHIMFKDVSFNYNDLSHSLLHHNAIVYVQDTKLVTFTDCTFKDNTGTPLQLINSTVTFSGAVRFISNTASAGGAIALFYGSTITLASSAQVMFENNSAVEQGGAVYINPNIERSEQRPCFVTIKMYLRANINLKFINNVAQFGGDAIYGDIDPCIRSGVFDLFNFIDTDFNTSHSLVSNTPSQVCVCRGNTPMCSKTEFGDKGIPVYPGQTFYIDVILLSDMSLFFQYYNVVQATGGSVLAELYSSNNGRIDRVGHLEEPRPVDPHHCTRLNYTLSTRNNHEFITLIPEYSPSILDPMLIVITMNLNILDCPLGFEQHGNPPNCTCICDDNLAQHNIICEINNQSVRRPSGWWIGIISRNDSVVVYRECPYGYCKLEETYFKLEEPDEQCNNGRSGVLCGECKAGLSLTFGSSKCRECSNTGLLLILLFAFLGIVLVIALKVFNLTIAVGSLNGIVFFANIIQSKSTTLFHNSPHSYFMQMFISWLNLDVGVDTCFFDGMNAFSSTLLQFVFPVYIWCLVIVIIIASRYSTAIAEQNWVPVLATLFILSYSKILNNIFIIFSLSMLDDNDKRIPVWAYDGNVGYDSTMHALLLAVGSIFLIMFLVPYSILMTFYPLMQKFNHRFCSWFLIKLKPLCDANFAPFNDHHRYWFGVLLIIRVLLLGIVNFSRSNSDLILISVTAILLLAYIASASKIYKKKLIAILEIISILNLGIVTSSTLYVRIVDGNLPVLVSISTGAFACTFLVVLFAHGYIYALPLVKKMWKKPYFRSRVKTASYQNIENEKTDSSLSIQFPVPVTFSELRESMLEDYDD